MLPSLHLAYAERDTLHGATQLLAGLTGALALLSAPSLPPLQLTCRPSSSTATWGCRRVAAPAWWSSRARSPGRCRPRRSGTCGSGTPRRRQGCGRAPEGKQQGAGAGGEQVAAEQGVNERRTAEVPAGRWRWRRQRRDGCCCASATSTASVPPFNAACLALLCRSRPAQAQEPSGHTHRCSPDGGGFLVHGVFSQLASGSGTRARPGGLPEAGQRRRGASWAAGRRHGRLPGSPSAIGALQCFYAVINNI